MAERDLIVTETLRVEHDYHVRARTRAEAIEKVERHEFDYVVKGEAWPISKLRARLARWGRQP